MTEDVFLLLKKFNKEVDILKKYHETGDFILEIKTIEELDAFQQIIRDEKIFEKFVEKYSIQRKIPQVNKRIIISEHFSMKDYDSLDLSDCGNFFSLIATVKAIESPSAIPKKRTYYCNCHSCHESPDIVEMIQFPQLSSISVPKCKNGRLWESKVNEWTYCQEVKISSPQIREFGKTSLVTYLYGDDINTLKPLETYKFSGKLMLSYENLKNNVETMTFDCYGVYNKHIEDLEPIEPLSIEELCEKFAPEMVGANMEKLACMLTLISDPFKEEERMTVLIVGDPGLGKSTLLKAMKKNEDQNTIYATGESTTIAGLLTAVISKREVEPGLFALSDNKTICFDEYDKCPDTLKKVFERYLWKEDIHVAKANALMTLKKRCSAVIVSNPIGGVFVEGDKSRQLPFKDEIQNFDLVFLMYLEGDRSEKMAQYVKSTLFPKQVKGLKGYFKKARAFDHYIPLEIDDIKKRKIVKLLHKLTMSKKFDQSLVKLSERLINRFNDDNFPSNIDKTKVETIRSQEENQFLEIVHLLKLKGPMTIESISNKLPHFSKEKIGIVIEKFINNGSLLVSNIGGEEYISERQ